MKSWKINSKYVLHYIGKHRTLVMRTFFFLIGATIFEGLGVSMIVPILHSMEGGGVGNVFTKYARIGFGSVHLNYSFINLIIIFTIMMLTKYIFMAINQHFIRVLSASITHGFREASFENLMRVPLNFYYRRKLGEIVATQYTSSISAGGMIEYVMLMINGMIFCSAYMVIACLISAPLALCIFVITIVSYIFIVPRFRVGFLTGEKEKKVTDGLYSFLYDNLGGIKILKAFGNERYHIVEYEKLIQRFKKLQIKIKDNQIIAFLLLEPLLFLLVIGIMVISVNYLHLNIVSLATFIFIFLLLIPRAKAINSNLMQIKTLLPHFTKIHELINTEDVVYLSEGNKSINNVRYKIEFKNVYFSYPFTDGYALKGINTVFDANKTTALVGISGGGKTTMIDLLTRLHDLTQGAIEVDGVDLKEIKTDCWHKLIGVVDQDPYLFNDTIYNNILYGKLRAAKEEVLNAAKIANIHDYIDRLPDKYETMVGNRGIKLSGGQKQRVALARALIRNPEILILDEATSALDSESERLIQMSIDKLHGKKTMVVIAHRFGTIMNADKIVVINNGAVLEEGTHGELLAQDGKYKEYYNLQFNLSK
mgnify:CR=1 FL=1|jgi:ABC-type multidrug transport system fused ATPase/permease subunit